MGLLQFVTRLFSTTTPTAAKSVDIHEVYKLRILTVMRDYQNEDGSENKFLNITQLVEVLDARGWVVPAEELVHILQGLVYEKYVRKINGGKNEEKKDCLSPSFNTFYTLTENGALYLEMSD
jgi:hypothetical protein